MSREEELSGLLKELEVARNEEKANMQIKVDKLEAEAVESAKEISRQTLLIKQIEKKSKDVKAKIEKSLGTKAEELLSTVDELKQQLSQNKQDVRHIQEEYEINICELKRIFG